MDVTTERDFDSLVERTLYKAEGAVIGSMIIDESCIPDVMLKVVPEHFIHAEYRHMFEAIRGLWQARQPIDVVTVEDALGEKYHSLIIDLVRMTPTAAHVMKYTAILQRDSQLHRIKELAITLAMQTDDMDDARKISEQIYQLLSDRQDLQITTWQDGLKDFFDRQSDPTPPQFLPWGIPAMDENLTAELGDFVVIGATPSSGKTALALQFAMHMASKGYRVGFFSFETKDKKLVDRIVAQQSSVTLSQIKHKQIKDNDWERIVKTVAPTGAYPLEIIRAAGMTVADIQAITMSHRYQIVVVDYLQLVRSSGYSRNRTEEVTRISLGLHEMCGRLGVCVIGLSQLSRPDKTAKPRDPTMSDLRESGQIEQDAEIIMLLNSVAMPERKLIVDKNKDGEAADIPLVFDAQHVRFRQRAKRDYGENDDDDEPRRRHQGARSRP